MGKTIKIAISLLIGLVLLLIIAAVALPLLIDPNDFRDEISGLVEKQTGRKLTIEGEIGFSVFPWLGIELGKMELSNAPGFGDRPFAGIEQADLKIKLLPLLRKQVEIKTVVLHGLDVNLARDKSGKTNWDDLVSTTKEPSTAETPQEGEPATLASLEVSGIEIRNARISWDDQQSGVRYGVENLDLESGALAPGKPFPLTLEMEVAASQPAVRARLRLSSQVTFDLEQENYRLDSPDITLDTTGEVIPGNRLELTFGAEAITADLKQQTATLQGMSLLAAGARVTGDVKVDKLLDGQAIQGAIRLVLADPAKLQPLLGEEPPPVDLAALKGVQVDIPFNADLGSQHLEVKSLSLQGLGARLTGEVAGQKILDAPRFTGSLNLARLNLRELLQKLAVELPPMADPATLQALALNLDFDATTDQATVKKLKLRLDDTTVQGNAGVENFAKPAIRFDLAVDAIDVDRYLPPPEKETEATPEPKAGSDKLLPDFELPLEPLKTLNLQGKLRLDKLKVSGLHASDILLTTTAKEGKLRIDPLQAALYQGRLETRLLLDAGQKPASLRLNTALKGLQAGPLLKDLLDDDLISGKANITIDVRGQGDTFLQLRQTLNGKAAFRFEDGAVKGINIAQMLRKAQAALTNKKLPKEEEPLKTDFSELKGTFTIKDGVVSNRDLSAKAPILRVSGEGTVNLVSEAIDYRLTTAIVGTAAGQGGKELQELKGLAIPIRITGTLAKPKIKEDLTSALKAKTQAELDKKKKELEAKLKAEEAKARAELEAKKAKAKAELEAKAKAEEARAKARLEEEKEKAKQKMEEELKKKAGELFKF